MSNFTPGYDLPDGQPARLLVEISDDNDQRVLEGILDPARWRVLRAFNWAAATACLAAAAPDVILMESYPPDGEWQDLLQFINAQHSHPPVVVMSRAADERLWAEVLTMGGFDVLSKPLVSDEASHVLAMALRYGAATCTVEA